MCLLGRGGCLVFQRDLRCLTLYKKDFLSFSQFKSSLSPFFLPFCHSSLYFLLLCLFVLLALSDIPVPYTLPPRLCFLTHHISFTVLLSTVPFSSLLSRLHFSSSPLSLSSFLTSFSVSFPSRLHCSLSSPAQVCCILLSAGIRMRFPVRLSLCLLGFILISLLPQPARGQGKYLHKPDFHSQALRVNRASRG